MSVEDVHSPAKSPAQLEYCNNCLMKAKTLKLAQ